MFVPSFPLAAQSLAAAAFRTAVPREAPLPLDVPWRVAWVKSLLLVIVWLFIAAVLVGPVVKYVRQAVAGMQRR